ncbi:O-antigen ligase family protein [Novosphingobium resinovorum]|uniref:O-antigen ligase family protein n=1 Tax=Novosphingobium resinovorum TaxID=158500 RepID=UPI002ED69495|nr:O-antigen ligase family protein [Novosphingobium resinovorum]
MASALRMPLSGTVLASVLLVTAVVFGGGGAAAGLMNLVVELAALAVLLLSRGSVVAFLREAPRPFAVLVTASLALPLIQCVPLPPALWHMLPGRDLAREALVLVDRQDVWFPMSLDVRRTFGAFLSLLAPATIIVLSWRASTEKSRNLLLVMVACGVGLVLFGAQQLALGNTRLILYAETFRSTDLHGVFANHNAAGLFIDIALCALIGAFPRRRVGTGWIAFGVGAGLLLLLGLILSRSRSGMVLVVVPAALLLARIWIFDRLREGSRALRLSLVGGFVLLCAAGGVVVATNHRTQASLSRFDQLQDARPAIWADSLVAIRRYWPLGSGIGTFDEVIQVDESLETLSPGRAGRAHNDFLETTLESGVIGIGLVAAWVVVLAIGGFRCLRRSPAGLGAAGIMMLIGFQSILDYPLRSQALLCVAGVAIGLICGGWSKPEGLEEEREEDITERRRVRRSVRSYRR